MVIIQQLGRFQKDVALVLGVPLVRDAILTDGVDSKRNAALARGVCLARDVALVGFVVLVRCACLGSVATLVMCVALERGLASAVDEYLVNSAALVSIVVLATTVAMKD